MAGWAEGPFWTGYGRKTFIVSAGNRTKVPRWCGPYPIHYTYYEIPASYGVAYLNFRVEGTVAPR